MADVEFDLDKGVLWCRLNRPEQMNAMTSAMRDDIIERIWASRSDTGVRAIVITGTGKGFCTGADLSRPAGAPAPTELPPVGTTREMLRTGSQRLLRCVWEVEKPVVAAVNGTAAGLGAHLAFASDIILAAASARFIEVFVRRGIAIDAAGGFLVPRVMPLCKAKELVFFGDALSAEDALAMGLVNRVVADADLEKTTREWAERLAEGPTFAIGVSKRLLNRGTEVGLDTSLEEEAYAQSIVTGSDDAKEGMASFREKRKPAFRGR